MDRIKEIQLIEKLKRQARHGNIFDDIEKQLKSVFNQYKLAGDDIAREGAFTFLADQTQQLYEKLNILEERNLKVQSGFRVSTSRAAELGYQFDELGNSIGVNSDKLKTYLADLNKTFAGQAQFFKKGNVFTTQISKEAELIQNKLKITDDAFQGFLKFQTTANKESQKGVLEKQFINSADAIGTLAQEVSGVYTGAITDLVEGLGKLPASIQATMGQYPKQLGLAVLKAKQLGLSLEKVQSIAEGTLDVEQSIAAELEYQILSGKELTVDGGKSLMVELQKAALQQDANRQVDLMAMFLRDNGEQLKDNIYLANQVAQMFGVSKDELFGAYQQLQANEEISKDLFNQQTKNDAITKGAFDAQVDAEDRRIELEKRQDEAQQAATKNLLEAYGSPEKMKEEVEKLAKLSKDMQTTALANAADLAKIFSDSDYMKYVFGAGGLAKTLRDAFDALRTGNFGSPEAIGETRGDAQNAKDIFIPAGGANTIISGPKGSFSLDPDDDIIAMPNARAALANRGGTDTTAIVDALKGMSFHVTNVFDGDKIQSRLSIRQGQRLNNIS